ncbi:hypothetical protein AA21952_3336 [Acetobacter oeni LMG 21952]|nr:hypothetical protein AA21952_3336 [Acetobacter oeni LMG 21952]
MLSEMREIDAICCQTFEEAETIRGGALNASVLAEDKRVHGTGEAGREVRLIDECEGGFLVRDRDVCASETGGLEATHGDGELLRADGERNIGAVDIPLFEPVIVQDGRQGVRDRVTEDAGEFCLTGYSAPFHGWLS